MKPRTALLVYGAGANQLPVIDAGLRRGWRTIAVDRDPRAPGAALASRFVCTSLRDHEGIRAAVAEETLGGVVARVTDPEALASARRMAEGFGLAAPEERLLRAATSKRAFEDLCRAAGVATPARRTREQAEVLIAGAAGAVGAAGARICVRPDVTIRGKAAIRRVASPDALERACAAAAASSGNGAFDLSAWIDGRDVSVLAAFDRGRAHRIALFDEWVAVGPDGGIAGMGAGMPSRFEGAPAAIDASLSALARACPQSRSLVTLSLRIDAAGVAHAIEIHLGLGGDALADRLLPAALAGFDAFDALVAFAVGDEIEWPTTAPLARGLLRAIEPSDGESWMLVEAPDAPALRALARSRLVSGWECPPALVEDLDEIACGRVHVLPCPGGFEMSPVANGAASCPR